MESADYNRASSGVANSLKTDGKKQRSQVDSV